jgi:tryptophan synthase beta subunit
MPALEPAHAIAYVKKVANKIGNDKIVIINLSGRGDKDIDIVRDEQNK